MKKKAFFLVGVGLVALTGIAVTVSVVIKNMRKQLSTIRISDSDEDCPLKDVSGCNCCPDRVSCFGREEAETEA